MRRLLIPIMIFVFLAGCASNIRVARTDLTTHKTDAEIEEDLRQCREGWSGSSAGAFLVMGLAGFLAEYGYITDCVQSKGYRVISAQEQTK